jgi:hypothetical protein
MAAGGLGGHYPSRGYAVQGGSAPGRFETASFRTHQGNQAGYEPAVSRSVRFDLQPTCGAGRRLGMVEGAFSDRG